MRQHRRLTRTRRGASGSARSRARRSAAPLNGGADSFCDDTGVLSYEAVDLFAEKPFAGQVHHIARGEIRVP